MKTIEELFMPPIRILQCAWCKGVTFRDTYEDGQGRCMAECKNCGARMIVNPKYPFSHFIGWQGEITEDMVLDEND